MIYFFKPPIIKYRYGKRVITAALVADQFSSQFHHIRHVKVKPFDAPVIHALETRIQSAANMDHDRIRISREEVAHMAVKFPHTHDDCALIMPLHPKSPPKNNFSDS